MKKLLKLYVAMKTELQSVTGNERGATMVEYGLMLALIAVVCVGAVSLIGDNANTMFGGIATHLAP